MLFRRVLTLRRPFRHLLALPVLVSLFAVIPASDVAASDGVNASGEKVVVVGVIGLSWGDVSPTSTPNLWQLLDDGAAAASLSMNVPGDSCALNGWLTLSAGEPSSARLPREEGCLQAEVGPGPEGLQIEGWDALVERQEQSVYQPDIGLLGSTLSGADVCITWQGVGPAITAATTDGTIPDTDVGGCALSVVDGGVVKPDDRESLRNVDALLGVAMDNMRPTTTLMVTSLDTAVADETGMGVAVLYSSATPADGPHYLTSASTRWEGVVTLSDVTATVVSLTSPADGSAFVGSPWRNAGSRPDTAATVDDLTQISDRDRVLRQASPYYLGYIGVVSVLCLLAVSIAPQRGRTWFVQTQRRRVIGLSVIAWAAAFPAASYAVGAIPWWKTGSPLLTLVVLTFALAGILAVVLVKVARTANSAKAVLLAAGITFLVLAVDAIGQSFLDRASPAGPSPTLGGRFYGFGNSTAAYFSVSTIFVVCLATAYLLRRGQRRAAFACWLSISSVAVIIDVAPGLGADVGGGLALVPILALCGLVLFGAKVSYLRVIAAFGAGVVVVFGLAFLDWLRPAANRTHLGRFVQDLIDGDAMNVVSRKAGYVWHSVDLAVPTVLTIALTAFVVYQWQASRGSPPRGAWSALLRDRTPRVTLAGAVSVLIVSGLLNDYGVVVLTIGLLLLMPLMLLWGYDEDEGFQRLYDSPTASTPKVRARVE